MDINGVSNITDHIFHSLITDEKLTEKIASEVLADISSDLVSIEDVKEVLQRYQQKICFEYVKIIGAYRIDLTNIDVPDLPFS